MTTKIIVLDDDPTGSQTVHSCPLLTQWTPDVLRRGLASPSPLMFILSNTRALDADDAASVTREICKNLRDAVDEEKHHLLIVSRSDSTLRGHFPIETDVISRELGPFDALFLVPAFLEGGRVTIDGVHYIREGESLVRTDQTEFAKDSVFGYSTSYLPAYVEEKTRGGVRAGDVRLLPAMGGVRDYYDALKAISDNRVVAVDCTDYPGLRKFADAVMRRSNEGARYLFRSGASLLAALAGLPPQPTPGEDMWRLRRTGAPGVFVVGSHVRKTTAQVEALLQEPGVAGIELDVDDIANNSGNVVDEAAAKIAELHSRDRTVCVYTSRNERRFAQSAQRIAFGKVVSAALVDIVRRLPPTTSYLVSKGGITSNDILSKGLNLAMCTVIGQIIPGCTVILTPQTHALPGLPVVIFPGNVGDESSLAQAHRILDAKRNVLA